MSSRPNIFTRLRKAISIRNIESVANTVAHAAPVIAGRISAAASRVAQDIQAGRAILNREAAGFQSDLAGGAEGHAGDLVLIGAVALVLFLMLRK